MLALIVTALGRAKYVPFTIPLSNGFYVVCHILRLPGDDLLSIVLIYFSLT